MKEQPFISVIVPAYKVEDYLKECVDSILNQTVSDFELILVDDGSPDGCPAICDRYAARDGRVKVIHKENGGLSSARNAGMALASGEYIVFVDSDDYYDDKGYFESVARSFKNNPIDIIFCRYKIDSNGKKEAVLPFDEKTMEDLKNWPLLQYLSSHDQLDSSSWSKVFRREFLMKYNLFFKEGIYSEDVEWMCRCLLHVQTACWLPNIPYCYRMREGSITHNMGKKNIDDMLYSIEYHSDEGKKLSGLGKSVYLNFLSYQYLITLGLVGCFLNGKAKREYIEKLKPFKWLCKYADSPKTKKGCLAIRILGVAGGSWLLGNYVKHK